MKNLIALLISGALVVSGYSQTRNVLVGTNNAVVQPTNFWSADVTNARSGLGLGTAATNPASAFQPSSAVLSNLATGNGTDLTNITATIVGTNISITNVSGLQSALDSKLATNGNTTGTASNVTGVVALANGGTGTTNAASARTSLGATTVGGNIFTLANPDEIRFLRLNANSSVSALTAADFRTAIGVSTGVGTVTSVGMTVPSILSLSTPTITSSGTFALTLANQSSRHAFLAPNGGGVPAFRALDSDDLPALAIAKITGLQTALDGKLATSGTATLATNVTGIVALANGGTGGSNAATARTSLGATTVGGNIFTLANPSAITFLRLNADNTATALSDSGFRTAIGLDTAATNPATAFQPSSTVLSNLASSNGAGLTNLTAANVTGTVALASNVTATIAISNGGSGATTAGGARTNFGLGWSALTNTNAATSLLGFTTNGQVVANTGTNVLTFTNQAIIQNNPEGSVKFSVLAGGFGFYSSPIDTNILYLPADDTVQLYEPVWNDPLVRASLGFSTNLSTLWTATNASNARSAVELGATNTPTFRRLVVVPNASGALGVQYGTSDSGIYNGANYDQLSLRVGGVNALTADTNGVAFANPATTRTNLGLGWSALTNSNAGTGLVSVNTNGVVVSPTNFWQVAPLLTVVQYSQPVVNSTNAASNSRNLYLYSLAISTTGITNTITLPTNTATFFGDVATIIHEGPTSSVTAIRQIGSATNIITINQFQEAVQFLYNGDGWKLADNISYTEPIYFSGTNAALYAAASRTNLGLGATWLTNTNVTNFRTAIGLGATNTVAFLYVNAAEFNTGDVVYGNSEISGYGRSISIEEGIINGNWIMYGSLGFDNTTNAATTRTNLGLGLPALTNTNNANFQAAIFNTNSIPTNAANVNAVNFNTAIHWMEVNVVTNGVTNNFRIPLFK